MPAEPYEIGPDSNIFEFLRKIFSTDFMPHGHCYYWRSDILWLNVISDLIIALAYYSIPAILIYFVLKRKKVPFDFLFFMFGAFIFLCGSTHLVAVMTVWSPAYRFAGIVKALTAFISIATAIAMIPIIPKALKFPGMESLIQQLSEKTMQLSEANANLERFNRLAMGREDRIIELKQEVNKLSSQHSKSQPYDV